MNGIINLYKPTGITSHTAVAKIRRLFDTKKVGHTGTLDPMASGVLPILVGNAVKASEYMTESRKAYRATLKLGFVTDTQDITGTVLEKCNNIPDANTVISTAKTFEGEYMQLPPMYSAIKQNGKKLYELAREGITVERENRRVEIYSLDIVQINADEYILTVHCSKGTYIRTLLHDIGQKLGCGGCMAALERINCCGFDLSHSVTFEELEASDTREKYLIAIEDYFSEYSKLTLEPFYARLARNGAEIYLSKLKNPPAFTLGNRILLFDSNGFFALGEVKAFRDGLAVKPIKMFV